ncbi:heparan sulfate glucosamine 3-O-sulfotransferase 1-like [Diadema antillarum]|uniref:heparan sulfate glucosamine 3-O-sulfotransferase 1-like n=2 Tax=Diadema antillarum TaxID=105358 RepID=UPI003A83FC30
MRARGRLLECRPLVLCVMTTMLLLVILLAGQTAVTISASGFLQGPWRSRTRVYPAANDDKNVNDREGSSSNEAGHFENVSEQNLTRRSRITYPPNIQCNQTGSFNTGTVTLDCRRRLPRVLCIGAKKCGTGAVRFFLKTHPAVVTSTRGEVHFWDRHQAKGLAWYRRMMSVSSQYQVTMETSPAYFVADSVPLDIARELSASTKLLLILRDPVARAVSDYTHVVTRYPHLPYEDLHKFHMDRPVYPHRNIDYIINKTFEESVLKINGEVNTDNALVFTGIYIYHLREWLKLFPLEQIFIIDGEEFVRNPLPQLKAIESFLGVSSHFSQSDIYFDEIKGFYCLARPVRRCQAESKGRTHPKVTSSVLQKLREFYRPYNMQLEALLGRTFSWNS